MTYYTIFLGNEPWEDCIDDMNQGEKWDMGSMYWADKEKAFACMENLKKPVFRFEDENNKFNIIEFTI